MASKITLYHAKKAFTLVEMLIVVVVLVTLMSIVFRLSSIGDNQSKRNRTISRLQRVENCLSGYYAAFGTYPPVKLHGSRDYNLGVNYLGLQNGDERQLTLDWYEANSANHGIGTEKERRDWRQVRAACMSQPVACRFPYRDGLNEYLKARSALAIENLANGIDTDDSPDHKQIVNAGYDDGYTQNPGRHNLDETDWRESQIFQFGLMSFLLPRYLVMMGGGDDTFFDGGAQWEGSNSLPTDPLEGTRFEYWSQVRQLVKNYLNGRDAKKAAATLTCIPSQAACARWMPNLEKTCYYPNSWYIESLYCKLHDDAYDDFPSGSITTFAPGGSQSPNSGAQYALDFATVVDGWKCELYYYSPPPYQSYVLWSSGPNQRTFPPWASRDSFSANQNKCIGAWIEDDIIHMSH